MDTEQEPEQEPAARAAGDRRTSRGLSVDPASRRRDRAAGGPRRDLRRRPAAPPRGSGRARRRAVTWPARRDSMPSWSGAGWRAPASTRSTWSPTARSGSPACPPTRSRPPSTPPPRSRSGRRPGRTSCPAARTSSAGALDHWPELRVEGRRCLDAGASTGGFTQVLLRRGAAEVVAVDVGYGQLAWSLRTDERVQIHDRTNVRDLTPELIGGPVDLIVADLSFISLTVVLPALAGCLRRRRGRGGDGEAAVRGRPGGRRRRRRGPRRADPGRRGRAGRGRGRTSSAWARSRSPQLRCPARPATSSTSSGSVPTVPTVRTGPTVRPTRSTGRRSTAAVEAGPQ